MDLIVTKDHYTTFFAFRQELTFNYKINEIGKKSGSGTRDGREDAIWKGTGAKRQVPGATERRSGRIRIKKRSQPQEKGEGRHRHPVAASLRLTLFIAASMPRLIKI
jgi:hypothetical protein